MPAYRLVISGKVQGVFYRSSAKAKADEFGIKGWIKNLPDGRVEAFAQGDTEQLRRFVRWCNEGPKDANVLDVTAIESSSGSYDSFLIIG